jgi:hypothetical protein
MTTFDPSIGKSTQWKRGQPSPNPGGRPKSRLLSEALRVRLAESKPGDPERRSYAELIAANLVEIACSRTGTGAVAAANEIADRIEGRATQRLDVNDISGDLAARSDDELSFHLAHDRWPEESELLELASQQSEKEEEQQ